MKQAIKTATAIIGVIAAGILFWEALSALLWVCYYAGLPM